MIKIKVFNRMIRPRTLKSILSAAHCFYSERKYLGSIFSAYESDKELIEGLLYDLEVFMENMEGME